MPSIEKGEVNASRIGTKVESPGKEKVWLDEFPTGEEVHLWNAPQNRLETKTLMPDIEKINRWWQKAMKKEERRASHHPKAPMHQRFAVPTRDKNVEPTSGRKRDRWMTTKQSTQTI